MGKGNVAILDIRSNEISFSLGAKGVNGTFVFSDSHNEPYEGFLDDGFLDEKSFCEAVRLAVTSVRHNHKGKINEVFVGVPSAFVSVKTKGHTLSFSSKRKISALDIDALFESGLNELQSDGRCIRRSQMYFSLGDNRKYFSEKELYGVPTNLLKGALCYYFVPDTFYDTVYGVLNELSIQTVHFIPSTLSQALYLLPEVKREGYAFLLDVGFLTTSITVLYGNGIVHEETFNCGIGEVLVALMEEFDVDFSTAEEILASADISGGGVPKEMTWGTEAGDKLFSVQKINDVIKYTLDSICERVDAFFAKYYKDKNTTGLTVNPISITGEGVNGIRGIAEHVSRRISRLTEVVVPDLPYFDKPSFSSRIALLNAAVSEEKKRSWIQRIFRSFGGKHE